MVTYRVIASPSSSTDRGSERPIPVQVLFFFLFSFSSFYANRDKDNFFSILYAGGDICLLLRRMDGPVMDYENGVFDVSNDTRCEENKSLPAFAELLSEEASKISVF